MDIYWKPDANLGLVIDNRHRNKGSVIVNMFIGNKLIWSERTSVISSSEGKDYSSVALVLYLCAS